MNYASFEETPIESVDFIKNLIEDKIVYEIGSGFGNFSRAMEKYAKKVIGIELENPLSNTQYFSDNIEIINDNFLKVDLKNAEIIYIFMGLVGNYALTKKLQDTNWHGTVISHFYPLMNDLTDLIKPNRVIDVNLGDSRFPFLIYNL